MIKLLQWLYTPIHSLVERNTRPVGVIFEDEGFYYVEAKGWYSHLLHEYRSAFKMDIMYKYIYREYVINKWGVWKEGSSWYRSNTPLVVNYKRN